MVVRRLVVLALVTACSDMAPEARGVRAPIEGAGADKPTSGSASAAVVEAVALPPEADPRDVVVVNAGGDVAYPFTTTSDAAWEANGPNLFGDIAPLLATGDLNFANLEGPFTRRGKSDPGNRVLISAPHRLAWVIGAGFNLFSLANNHSMDAGPPGLADTRRTLREASTEERPLWFAGAADTTEEAMKPTIITLPDKRTRIGVFALTRGRFHGVDWGKGVLERIESTARGGATVIVSIHDGEEFTHVPSADIAQRYRSFIDAGASVVFGHHPHVAQGVERYRGGVIFYSLGNLSFGIPVDRARTRKVIQYGLLARVTLVNGELEDARAIPLYIDNYDPLESAAGTLPSRFARPQRLTGTFAAEAVERLSSWSAAIPGIGPNERALLDDALVVGVP